MEQAIVNLLKVTITEIFECDLANITPEELVSNICAKAELALSPAGEEELQELINYLNINRLI